VKEEDGENYILRSFTFVLLTECDQRDEMKGGVMGETHIWEKGEMRTQFYPEILKDLEIDGRIILKYIFKMICYKYFKTKCSRKYLNLKRVK
jgi:hypothetical protein